jgi:two-component system chemotaxis sensor kinase CheA
MELTRAAFRQEADELLAELDTALLQLEASPRDGALLDRAFRATHTLKGSGATAGFDRLAALLHGVEDVLNEAREGRVAVDTGVVDLVLKVADVARRLLLGREPEAALVAEGHAAVRALADHARRPGAAAATTPPPATEPAAEPAPANGGVRAVRFAPHRTMFLSGNDPLLMLRELAGLGALAVRADASALPPFAALDPELCYLSFAAQIASGATDARLREVFEFVEDDADITIARVAAGDAWVLPPAAYFDPGDVADFLEEAAAQLAELEAQALALEGQPGDRGRAGAVFRALHNLKAGAALLLAEARLATPPAHPLRAFRDLCHAVEGRAERGDGGLAIAEGGVAVLLQAVDRLRSLTEDFVAGRRPDGPAPEPLAAVLGAAVPAASVAPARASTLAAVAAQCVAVARAIAPPGEARGPLTTAESKGVTRALQTLARAADYEGAAAAAGAARALIGAATAGAEAGSLAAPLAALEAALRAGAGPAAQGRTASRRPSRPAKASARPAPPEGARGVRVDQQKLDRLMRAVGELLVARNSLPTYARRLEAERSGVARDVKDVGDRISHIADDLQDAVMGIRMMPIRTVFQRFPRMIRDLARGAGKQVQLAVTGDDTELDKTVLEQLTDPLVHLVRNAVDHGVDAPDERAAAGKPAVGTVSLKVSREGSFVVIEVADDGRGMSPARLRDKAVERGLLTRAAADALTTAAAFELIFLPGFSTAAAVTSVSGRGVGMDVVRNNVRQLQGTIAIASEPGRGSAFRIKLPASLMVSKAILVESAGEQYVFPIDCIQEMVKLDASAIHGLGGARFAHVRGAVCPVASLAALLGAPEAAGADRGVLSAAIVRARDGDLALLVDRFVSEIDVIVKPLSTGLDRLRMFQGASILGDGRVALVIDPMQLGAPAPALAAA